MDKQQQKISDLFTFETLNVICYLKSIVEKLLNKKKNHVMDDKNIIFIWFMRNNLNESMESL